MKLWEHTPCPGNKEPTITYYPPKEENKTDIALVIFPGGGYAQLAPYEGEGYARPFSEDGIHCFVVEYRLAPQTYPLQLADARRAVRFVRAHAEEYGVDPQKIAVIGSSAGGHLAALLSTYRKPIDFEDTDEIDKEDYRPNAQILCYPVICAPDEDGIGETGSYINLLGGRNEALEKELDPINNVSEDTPPAFLWHTTTDEIVHVYNSYRYATALKAHEIPLEMHIFPFGRHGMGVASADPHVANWTKLLSEWYHTLGWR